MHLNQHLQEQKRDIYFIKFRQHVMTLKDFCVVIY